MGGGGPSSSTSRSRAADRAAYDNSNRALENWRYESDKNTQRLQNQLGGVINRQRNGIDEAIAGMNAGVAAGNEVSNSAYDKLNNPFSFNADAQARMNPYLANATANANSVVRSGVGPGMGRSFSTERLAADAASRLGYDAFKDAASQTMDIGKQGIALGQNQAGTAINQGNTQGGLMLNEGKQTSDIYGNMAEFGQGISDTYLQTQIQNLQNAAAGEVNVNDTSAMQNPNNYVRPSPKPVRI